MSIYIHIPFCHTICSYCDFCKLFYQEKLVDNYLAELEKEIQNKYQNESIKTLYIGGGTPSCLTYLQLQKLFSIIKLFNLSENFEFTFECNIESIDEKKLKLLLSNGVNRLSIGVQSFNEKILKTLNRNHYKELVFEKINLAKKIGFKNISIDLIYGVYSQTLSELANDLELFLQLDINHISTYSLIIEPHTKLYIDNIKEIAEEIDYEMYQYICNTLNKHGFIHYEISNFAKKGFESKHNLTYWNNLNYYGFGLGTSGYLKNVRYENTRSINKYLQGNYLLEKQELSKLEEMQNEMILGLRKIKGVNKKQFLKKFGQSITDVFDITDLLKQDKLIDDGTHIYINQKYLYLSNDILLNFID